MILPLTILRRLDCILEPDRETVRELAAKHDNPNRLKIEVKKATGRPFYNTSNYSFANLLADADEYNPQSYAICKSDLLAKGHDASNIAFGNTLTDDAFKGRQFDFCMSNPPYGVDWKQYAKAVNAEREQAGPYGRFATGLPSTRTGRCCSCSTWLTRCGHRKTAAVGPGS